MTELEVIHDPEIVQEEDIWESCVSEWCSAQPQVIVGQLRQARAAAAVSRVYGTSAMEKFAAEVDVSKSTVYEFARVWWVLGTRIEDGEYSVQLESGLWTMSHLKALSNSQDPDARAQKAIEEGESARAIEAGNREEKKKSEPKNVQTIEVVICPHCEEKFRLSEAECLTEVVD